MPFPLTAAERFVDFPAHDNEIRRQRFRVERGATRQARQLAYLIAELNMPTYPGQAALGESMALRLGAVASFGFQQARAELAAQRAQRKVLVAYSVPDAGRYGRIAQEGLARVRELARERARRAAAAITYAASAAAATSDTTDKAILLAVTTKAALRELHNNVLELVGEALNLGRTAGAMSLKSPPEFALRSEQLDKTTCDLCTREHGEIYQVGSSDYWSHLPPSNCLGGGRCRGLMVFGYGPEDVRAPEPTEEDLARIRRAA